MLAWQAILYFTVLNAAAALGLQWLVAAFKRDLEQIFSDAAGIVHTIASQLRACNDLHGVSTVILSRLPYNDHF